MIDAPVLKDRMISRASCMGCLFVSFALATLTGQACAHFVDNFDGPSVQLDPTGKAGWLFQAGDGTAIMDLRQGGPGYASIFVDGTTDKRGIWWALMERTASDRMDLSVMQKPGHEFRIAARVRSRHSGPPTMIPT